MEPLYGNQISKWLAMTFSILSMIITTPMIIAIINFEGNIHYRTLIGKLVSSNLATMIAWNLLVQVTPNPLTDSCE